MDPFRSRRGFASTENVERGLRPASQEGTRKLILSGISQCRLIAISNPAPVEFSTFADLMPSETKSLPILSFDHPSLKRRSPDVDISRPDLSEIVASLVATLERAQGCGIAAPMVGLEMNLIYIDNTKVYESVPEEHRAEIFPTGTGLRTEMVNARILSEREPVQPSIEANLCFPGLEITVDRPHGVEVEYQDLSGTVHRALFEGFDARVIQHELDHVNGVLFVDRLSPAKRSILAGKLRRISNGETRPSYPMKWFKAKR
jgi:peptide deformylase